VSELNVLLQAERGMVPATGEAVEDTAALAAELRESWQCAPSPSSRKVVVSHCRAHVGAPRTHVRAPCPPLLTPDEASSQMDDVRGGRVAWWPAGCRGMGCGGSAPPQLGRGCRAAAGGASPWVRLVRQRRERIAAADGACDAVGRLIHRGAVCHLGE
jgi:hypothetical protein